jgi:hypothetical protein
MTDFSKYIQEAINSGRKEELANEFEAALSTVDRWASGISVPLPNMQKIILRYLSKKSTEFCADLEDKRCDVCHGKDIGCFHGVAAECCDTILNHSGICKCDADDWD